MSFTIPEKIIPAHTFSGRNVRPMLSPRETKIVSALIKCKAAYRSTLERFWTHPIKGRQKVQALLRWGVLWSYTLGESEIVTLSPLSEKLYSAQAYVPTDPGDALKTALASEIYIKALQNGVPCEWEPAGYPLQGVINANGNRAGMLVLFKDENIYLGVKIRCFVICEDEEHIRSLSRSIFFPALYATLETLKGDISEAFCDGSLKRVRIKMLSGEN